VQIGFATDTAIYFQGNLVAMVLDSAINNKFDKSKSKNPVLKKTGFIASEFFRINRN
jgi:hypothetical protein